MRRNFLHGGIPSSFCKVAALQILDLAENNLVGPIPHCVGNITGMISAYNSLSLGESSGWGNEVVKQVIKGSELDYIRNLKYVVNLDLSNNFLSGSIPAEISSLSRLIGLNLSFNDFFGEIPKMIGDMKSLESIDLSHNHLSFWYYSKDHLNLSYNNLSGPIPDENQFQVLNDPLSYTGNQYLCGAPLPKHCPGDGPHHVHDIEGYKKEDRENDKLDRVVLLSHSSWLCNRFLGNYWGLVFQKELEVADKIYVAVILKVVILKEMMKRK
ncbi:hypothetical protein Ahy_Scaffold8g108451 [Arachis hypogaea]|uniref:Uncharacterized protein n=1 Tax=Arachis hypogaea TaxID=3818 RepID=A0A444WNJ2_ARAHY|nr:hypothetical protein Ahy_Scaffold8g108451 [Arachis hypogaea]